MFRIVYTSRLSAEMNDGLLNDIASAAIRNNSASDITGILLFTDGAFMQVLEGPKDAVEGLMATISADPRHTNVKRLFHGGAGERSFPDWHMKIKQLTAQEIEGVRDMESVEGILDPLVKPLSPEIDFFVRAFFDELAEEADRLLKQAG